MRSGQTGLRLALMESSVFLLTKNLIERAVDHPLRFGVEQFLCTVAPWEMLHLT